MKFSKVLEKSVRVLSGLKFVGRDPKLGKLDLAVLEVALMIAALDGKVQKSEIDAFNNLARKCRGANAKSIKAAYEAALRSAGYLAILVQIEDEKQVLAAFTDEVVKAMPENFLSANAEDVKRAFVIWTAMAMSDGDYSGIERKAIEMLEKRFTIIKSSIVEAEMERNSALSPAFQVAYGLGKKAATVRLLPKGFLEEVEAALAKTKDADVSALLKGE